MAHPGSGHSEPPHMQFIHNHVLVSKPRRIIVYKRIRVVRCRPPILFRIIPVCHPLIRRPKTLPLHPEILPANDMFYIRVQKFFSLHRIAVAKTIRQSFLFKARPEYPGHLIHRKKRQVLCRFAFFQIINAQLACSGSRQEYCKFIVSAVLSHAERYRKVA